MLVDSHCHLNFKAYKDDLSEVIGRCHQADMKLINVGAAFDTSLKAVELTSEKNFYASIGLHPIHVFDEEFDVAKYQELINNNQKIIAIGETGFDYWHMTPQEGKAKQQEVFEAHIKLAQKNNLPLIIHGRNGKDHPTAYQDIYNLLKQNQANKGVVHCYGGNLEEAKKFVELGFHLGFTGIITFQKAEELQAIAKWIPFDKMLIETDAPYLSPEPHRGDRNEPAYVKYVAQTIAKLRNMLEEDVVEITGQNAIELFNLK
ncbi:TatD family hydrolase [bacterium]|jgi:TatD DNase family protein|nr:TatD family hydrolase [bacterium]